MTVRLTEIRLNGQTLSVRQAVRDTDRADKEQMQNESATLDKQTQTYSQTEKKMRQTEIQTDEQTTERDNNRQTDKKDKVVQDLKKGTRECFP